MPDIHLTCLIQTKLHQHYDTSRLRTEATKRKH